MSRSILLSCLLSAIIPLSGTRVFAEEGKIPAKKDIVCYAALDEGFSRPLLEEFRHIRFSA